MILLFTDYGWQGPYVGQVKAVLHALSPGVAVVDLFHDVPSYNAHAGAHILDALTQTLPSGSVLLCVVDPGVGSERAAVVMEVEGRYFIGPDNGLLSVVAARASTCRVWRIDWRPEQLSESFHGRDVFAPVAARLATGGLPEGWLSDSELSIVFDSADLPRILYIDHFGNAWTGIHANLIDRQARLRVGNTELSYKRVFSEAAKGEAFWYENSAGLVEIAVNRASAATQLGLSVGDLIRLSGSPDSRLH